MKRAQSRKFHYIYRTTCSISGKFYIGMHSTDDIDDGYVGSGKVLWYSIKKHGKENHKTEILEFLPTRDQLKTREHQIINEDLLDDPLCMNLVLGGEGGNKIEWTEERRLAQSVHFKNLVRTEEHNRKIADGNSGKPLTEERKKKISESNKGRKLTEEQRKKQIDSLTGNTKISWKLLDPNGDIHITEDLGKFCRDRDLSFSGLYKNIGYDTPIIRGKAKGWKTLEKSHK